MQNDITPEPGIYENVPFETYLKWDAISNSMLSQAKRSLAHYRMCRMGSLVEETDAMRFGTLVHAGQLEPLALIERYVVRPRFEDTVRKPDGGLYDNPKASAAYKAEVAEWRKSIGDKIEVTASELAAMAGVVNAIARHDRAREYLGGPGPAEVSFTWVDPETGLRCKGRADRVSLERRLIADLKTTGDIEGFETSIAKRGYHRQAAFYADGIALLTGTYCRVALVAAESAEPFGVRAATLSEEAMLVGRDEYEGLLGSIAVAMQEQRWPGPDSPEEWQLPSWAMPESQPLTLTAGGKTFVL